MVNKEIDGEFEIWQNYSTEDKRKYTAMIFGMMSVWLELGRADEKTAGRFFLEASRKARELIEMEKSWEK